jgi:hypothetical protein
MAEVPTSILDPVPIGYVGLDEAVQAVTAGISNQQHSTWLAGISERARSFRDLLKEAYEGVGPEACKKAGIEPDAPIHFPFTEILLNKREMAICTLSEALYDRTLEALVREPASSELFRLTGSDWHGHRGLRETIISGFLRASIGEQIARHNGRRVLLRAPTFEAWLKTIAGVESQLESQQPTPLTSPEPQSEPKLQPEPRLHLEPLPDSEPTTGKRSRRRQRGQGPQTKRARFLLKQLFPDGYPTEGELPNRDLIDKFNEEYLQAIKTKAIKFSKLGPPSEEVILRETGRKLT